MVAVPVNPGVGVKMMFVPLMVAVPFVGFAATRLNAPPGVRTTSFVNGLNVFVESWNTV